MTRISASFTTGLRRAKWILHDLDALMIEALTYEGDAS